MSHAIGPMLYTDEEGNPGAVEVSQILTVTRLDDPRRPGRSFIRLTNGLPVAATEAAVTLIRRWVEVVSFSIPRDPANFPGYAQAAQEQSQ